MVAKEECRADFGENATKVAASSGIARLEIEGKQKVERKWKGRQVDDQLTMMHENKLIAILRGYEYAILQYCEALDRA
jgi:hypothetical protein